VTPDRPAYIAGNSLGGFLAVNLASQHPELVKGLVLLNAGVCVGVGVGVLVLVCVGGEVKF